MGLIGVSGHRKSVVNVLLLFLGQLDIDFEELDLLLACVSTGALLALRCGSGHITLVHHAIFVVAVDCSLKLSQLLVLVNGDLLTSGRGTVTSVAESAVS